MNGFACIGQACEENCCRSWNIPFDEAHYDRVREAMTAPEDRERFERFVEPVPEEARTPAQVARIRLARGTACPFRDDDELCSLHRRFGEEVLPDGCANYPRIVSLVGERRELAGALSCPEVARRALLTEDATDLVAAEPAAFGRGSLSLELRDEADAARLDAVRDALYGIATTTGYPLDSRLFCLAHFAHQTEALVSRRGDPDELEEAIAPLAEPAQLEEAHTLLASAPEDGTFGLACVVQLLNGAFGEVGSIGFPRVVEEVVTGYAHAPTVEELWPAYAAHRDAVPQSVRSRVDLYLANYAKHYCMTEWHHSAPRLLAHVQRLLLCVATLRFLILGHPAIAELDSEALDELAVRTVYSLSPATERNPRGKEALLELALTALPTFAHAAPLLRV